MRTVAILGHGNSGKTTLAENLLSVAGKLKRPGKVDEGTTAWDFEPEEIKRHITISTAFHHFPWQKNEIFLADTPGDDNFLSDTKLSLQGVDGAIFTVGAVLGVKGQTEKFVDCIVESERPRLICITKMDRERADFQKTVTGIRERFALKPVVTHFPIGAEADFQGVVDLLTGQAWFFDAESGRASRGDVPSDINEAVIRARENLMEHVAESDDDLLEVFFEEGELTGEQLATGLASATRRGLVTPVCCCAALAGKGGEQVLDLIVHLLPSPMQCSERLGIDPTSGKAITREPAVNAPFSGLVVKTMADPFAGQLTVIRVLSGMLTGDSFLNSSKGVVERFSQLYLLTGKEQTPVDEAGPGMLVAIAKLKDTVTGDTLCDPAQAIAFERMAPFTPMFCRAVETDKGSEDKLYSALTRVLDEDLSLRLVREKQTGEILLSGMGPVHLAVIQERLKRKFGVGMDLVLPAIPYQETIKGQAKVEGKHKKQSGGRGQYGDCWVEIEPLPKGGGFEFVDKIVGGVIPQQYRSSVEKGIIEAMAKGVVAGYPMVDIKAALVDGSFHAVDSSEMAFKVAGSLAFKKAAQVANPVLLEPIMEISIYVTQDHVGDIMGDLNSRRGRVLGMDSAGKVEVINAQVPQAEVLSYASELNAMTGGLGRFTLTYSHYEEVPEHLASKVAGQA